MSLADALAQERRARLAAERLLELKQKELFAANEQLSRHALKLSDEIVEKREEVETVRHVAEELRDEKQQVLQDLETAHHEVDIAQRRLWHSVETIIDGFAVFDADDRMVVANPAYLSIFDGMECVAPGITYGEILRILVKEGIVDTDGQRDDEWCAMMAARWADPDKKPLVIKFWNEQFVKLVDRRSENGDTVSLALDITDTIRRENELKEALLQAESANRAKSAFLAKMSHELRTPMNGVVGMADLLIETELDEEQKLFVETIRNSGESLLSLINDVLDFSKMEAAKLVLHEEEFDLERTISDVLMLFHPAVAEKDVSLVIDYDMFLPTTFVGDPGRVRQILTNLVGNAVKFTEAGHVLVRVVGLPDGDSDRFRIHVSVEDTGPGIPEEMREHIFGEFNQVEDEKNRKFEGTGLGLAISRQLVTLMGGEIWVDSEVGKGSAFGFHVPMAAAQGSRFELGHLPDWIGRVHMVRQPGIAAEILAAQLRTLGAEVLETTETAFAEGKDLLPGDVVIVDNERSDATGARVCAKLRNAGHMTPIVIMQNLQEPGKMADAEHIIALNKPVTRRRLIEALSVLPELADTDAAASPPSLAKPAQGSLEKSVNPPAAQPRKMRILAAEDNKTNRLVFSKLVKTLNIDLEFAENGREAVEKWQELRPDLVFMDISMPEMDGKEATGKIREAESAGSLPRTPIVALTAHALSGDDEEFLAAGLDHYLTKPLKKAAIFEQIRNAAPDEAEPVFGPESVAAAE